jgi:hypothetical protein
MVEDVLREPRRPEGKFFLVDTRGLDLESCCQCGDDTLAHKVNHADHTEFGVRKKDDYNGRACRHFRALAAREDVVLMSTDLYGGALCCRSECADTCGTPKLTRHVTYDDFAVGIDAREGRGDDGSSRRFLASFRGGCRRGLWNSSTVRLDAKAAADALSDPDVVFDCGGFEVSCNSYFVCVRATCRALHSVEAARRRDCFALFFALVQHTLLRLTPPPHTHTHNNNHHTHNTHEHSPHTTITRKFVFGCTPTRADPAQRFGSAARITTRTHTRVKEQQRHRDGAKSKRVRVET